MKARYGVMRAVSTSVTLPEAEGACQRQLASGLSRWILAAVLFLVPLALAPGVFFHFDVTPKIIVLLAGTAAAVLFRRPEAAPASRETRWMAALLLAQAGWLAVTTVFSTDPALSLAGTNWRRFGWLTQFGLVVFTGLVLHAGPAAMRPLLGAVAGGGGLAGLYGILQYFGWDPWNPGDAYHVGEGVWTIVRPPGTLGHAGYFSVYLLHAAAAGLALAWTAPQRWLRHWGAGAALCSTAAILLSGTRAALLGLAAGIFIIAMRQRPRLTVRRAAAIVALAAGLTVFYFSPAGLLLRARTRWYFEDAQGGGRLTLWADTLRMSAGRWLTGYGPETFSSQYPRFQSEALARRFPDRYFESPHNIFLDALALQGVAGCLLLVLMTLLAWRALGCAVSRPLGDALAAGLGASLAANQFVAFTAPTALLFYTTAALAILAGRQRVAGPLPAIPVMAGRITTAVLLVSALLFAWTDFWLARVRAGLEGGQLETAFQDYRRLRRFRLPGIDTDLWYSRALMAAAPGLAPVWQQAHAAARLAAGRSEQRPNASYNLAAFHAMQNDFAGTEQSLRAAMAWAPHWYKPRWMLAQVLHQAGRLAEAETEARLAEHLNGGQHPEVRQTWEQIRAAAQQK